MKAENHAMLMRFLGAILGVKIIRKWSLCPVLYWVSSDARAAAVTISGLPSWGLMNHREITPWKSRALYG